MSTFLHSVANKNRGGNDFAIPGFNANIKEHKYLPRPFFYEPFDVRIIYASPKRENVRVLLFDPQIALTNTTGDSFFDGRDWAVNGVDDTFVLNEKWLERRERDVELSALINIRISTQDVSVVHKAMKMTFTGALANLG